MTSRLKLQDVKQAEKYTLEMVTLVAVLCVYIYI